MATTPVHVLITVAFPEPLVTILREISPRLRLTVHPARHPDEIPAELWAQAEVLYTDSVLPKPEQAPRLRWVQIHYAGVDHLLNAPLLQKPEVQITTLSGAAASQVAEHALMMMLALGHHLPEVFNLQHRAEWPGDRWERLAPLELRESTVGIVGYGSVGREIARLLRPFGVTLLATKRDVMHPEDEGYTRPGLGDPTGDLFTRLYPIQALASMLRGCDFVVICLPLTPATRGIINAEALAAMKRTAYLIDVSRGGVVDSAALLQALQERRIAGAALDVFPEEPLPAESPFWKLPNVIITPHIAGVSRHYMQRAVELFAENLRRYLSGGVLLNRYQGQRGY